jgi:hypothetical protein
MATKGGKVVHPAFASTGSKVEDLLTIETRPHLQNSPKLHALLKQTGEGYNVEVKGKKCVGVETSIFCCVEDGKSSLWNLEAVLRELGQNLSDSCIRTAFLDDGVSELVWTCKETSTGAQLYLNGKLSGEFMVHCFQNNLDDGGGWEVHMTFYNRGCAILSDAFVNGSYKGMDVPTVPQLALRKKFVAGGHGIGLKDIIGKHIFTTLS